ncbi:hypothetical protein AJ88_48260 [Mesorhizobium amorphae CCBAU 01583]|nr:hypothetical protein AJ88_48260 [Mesorhizobium amorphae CCBAU 01583]
MPAGAQESANQLANQIASNQAVSEVVLIPNRVIYPGETVELGVLKQVTLCRASISPMRSPRVPRNSRARSPSARCCPAATFRPPPSATPGWSSRALPCRSISPPAG